MRQKALKSWLLDRVEDRAYWFDASGNPTVTTLARLAESLSADEDFTSVAELYAPRQDLAKTVRELLSEEHVPFVSALRYKPAGLKKRADWEHVWDLQREEDAAPDEPAKRRIRQRTPVPPKYTSADFLKPSFWRARGKLDVPKERFVSYGTVNAQSPELYGWAGWDHLEQALALASYVQQAGLGDDDLVPYLAGLLELQPWLEQWYGEYDPEFGASPAAEILAFRQQKQGELGLTEDALRAWLPAAAPAAAARKRLPYRGSALARRPPFRYPARTPSSMPSPATQSPTEQGEEPRHHGIHEQEHPSPRGPAAAAGVDRHPGVGVHLRLRAETERGGHP